MGIITLLKSLWEILIPTKKAEKSFFTKDIFKDKPYSIGDYTYGKPEILFDNSGAKLTIGKFCSISGETVIFLGGNHRTDWNSTYPFMDIFKDNSNTSKIMGHPKTNGDVVIGNDVWLGYNVTIMSGVVIADGAVVAANSTVTKSIGPYEIWGGNPAKFIRKRFSDSRIKKLLEIQWWDWEIDKILKYSDVICNNSDINIQ